MKKRRDLLMFCAAIAITGKPAWGVSAASNALRYRNWITKFQRGLLQLKLIVAQKGEISEEEVGIIFQGSIVPHSRAALMVSQWTVEAGEKRDRRRGARVYADIGTITVMLLEHSVPAGYGGLFKESRGSSFPSNQYSVWYMHIGGYDVLQAYFGDKTQFPNYTLPPQGTLRRHAYPFLLFEETGESLRLAGIGSEWMGAAIYLHQKQYF